ncbi:MAG: hypothetical protein ACE149_14205 [Armatimonadota bacterium]
MRRHVFSGTIALCGGAALVIGCGKPSLPGKQFQGPRATVPGTVATNTPLPAKPFQEWGSKDAKVRLAIFFPIDKPHQALADLAQELTKQYPGKVYVKYIDYRTPEGAQLFQGAKATVACVMINGETSAELPSKYGARTVDFVKEMGRYWTADDLREAVANEVKKVYGGGAGAAK